MMPRVAAVHTTRPSTSTGPSPVWTARRRRLPRTTTTENSTMSPPWGDRPHHPGERHFPKLWRLTDDGQGNWYSDKLSPLDRSFRGLGLRITSGRLLLPIEIPLRSLHSHRLGRKRFGQDHFPGWRGDSWNTYRGDGQRRHGSHPAARSQLPHPDHDAPMRSDLLPIHAGLVLAAAERHRSPPSKQALSPRCDGGMCRPSESPTRSMGGGCSPSIRIRVERTPRLREPIAEIARATAAHCVRSVRPCVS